MKYRIIMRESSADMMGWLGRYCSGHVGFVNRPKQAICFSSRVNALDFILTCEYLQFVNEPCWIEAIN